MRRTTGLAWALLLVALVARVNARPLLGEQIGSIVHELGQALGVGEGAAGMDLEEEDATFKEALGEVLAKHLKVVGEHPEDPDKVAELETKKAKLIEAIGPDTLPTIVAEDAGEDTLLGLLRDNDLADNVVGLPSLMTDLRAMRFDEDGSASSKEPRGTTPANGNGVAGSEDGEDGGEQHNKLQATIAVGDDDPNNSGEEAVRAKYDGYSPVTSMLRTAQFSKAIGLPRLHPGSLTEDRLETSMLVGGLMPNAFDSGMSGGGGEPDRSSYSGRMLSSGSSAGSLPSSSEAIVPTDQYEDPTREERVVSSVKASVSSVIGTLVGAYLGHQGWNQHERQKDRAVYIRLDRPKSLSSRHDTQMEEVEFQVWRGTEAFWKDVEETFGNDITEVEMLRDVEDGKEFPVGTAVEDLPDRHEFVLVPKALKVREAVPARNRLFVRIPNDRMWERKLHRRDCAAKAIALYGDLHREEMSKFHADLKAGRETSPPKWSLARMAHDFAIPNAEDGDPFFHLAQEGCGGVHVGRFFWMMRDKQIEDIFEQLVREHGGSDDSVCLPMTTIKQLGDRAPKRLSKILPDAATATKRIAAIQRQRNMGEFVDDDQDTPSVDLQTFKHALWDYEPLAARLVGEVPPVFVWVTTPEQERFKRVVPDHIKAGQSFSLHYETDRLEEDEARQKRLAKREIKVAQDCAGKSGKERVACSCKGDALVDVANEMEQETDVPSLRATAI